MAEKAYKSNKATPMGDSDKPRSFPSSEEPRKYKDKTKKEVV